MQTPSGLEAKRVKPLQCKLDRRRGNSNERTILDPLFLAVFVKGDVVGLSVGAATSASAMVRCWTSI